MGDRINRFVRHHMAEPIATTPLLRLFMVLCLCLLWQGEAQALALLGIRSFTQSAGASYSFFRSTNSAAGSRPLSERETTEDYSAGFDYVLLAPGLARGNCVLDLEWRQDAGTREQGESQGSQTQLRYNVNGSLLSRSSTPLTFTAHSSRETISLPFTPTYQSESDAVAGTVSVLNSFIPSDVALSRQTQQTSGLTQNVRQESQSLSFGARPNLGSFGGLNLGVSLTQSDSTLVEREETSRNRSASSQIGYNTSWNSDRGLSRSVVLAYSYQQSSGIIPLNQQSLNGGLDWQLGRLLESRLGYFSSKSNGSGQGTESRGMTGMLSHKLMGSLTSSLYLSSASTEFQGGDNSSYGVGLGLDYSKKLPSVSNVTVGYRYGINYDEHNGTVGSVKVYNERHDIPVGPAPRIRLDQPTFQAETIQVVGVQSQLAYPPSSYVVVPEGIQLMDRYDIDTAIMVTYDFRQDPSVAVLGTSHILSGAVSLFAGKYRIYTDYKTSGQELVSGASTSLTMNSNRHFDLGASGTVEKHTLAAEIGSDQDYAQDIYYLNSSWGYQTSFWKGSLNLTANDRYALQSVSGGGRMWTNSFNAQSGYRRQIGKLQGLLKMSYANVMYEGGGMYQTGGLSGNLEARFGKLTALLNANSTWSFSDGGDSSSQGVSVSVRRSF